MNSNKNNIKLLLGTYIIITITIFGILFCVYIIMDYRTKYLKYKKQYINLKNKHIDLSKSIENKHIDLSKSRGGNYTQKISPESITLNELSYMLSPDDLKLFKKKNYKSAYTYGTLSKEGLYNILIKSKEYNRNIQNPTFLDIGSGDGKLVIWASEYGVNKSLGVELSKKRYNLSLEYKKRLNENIKKKIHFYNDDILDFDIKNNNIDIIYISSLCMPKHLIYKITEKLSKETKKGTIIFSSSPLIKTMTPRPTPIVKDNNLEYIGDMNVRQSWKDKCNMNIYKTY